MRDTVFYRQAELLLRFLPVIHGKDIFAIKGGTALNFFVRDFPRLSVDIDLVYLPIKERNPSLLEISNGLSRIAEKITKMMPGVTVVCKKLQNSEFVKGMVVNKQETTVKIEANLVFRGTVYKPEIKPLSRKASEVFELSMEIRTLRTAELYAGKICAALDRQHPRDLFDIRLLFRHGGIDDEIRKTFIVYLISHPRPIVELLNPGIVDIERIYETEFKGMTVEPPSFEEIAETRNRLISGISKGLTWEEKQFLVSVKKGDPEWEMLGLKDIEHLPAVKWKLLNIRKMDKQKHKKALEKLRAWLEV